MQIDILTIFPEMFEGPFSHSIVERAQKAGIVGIRIHDLRNFTEDRHRTVDDTPYGGGGGMIFRPEPLARALRALTSAQGPHRTVFLTPEGRPLTQRLANHLSLESHLILLCGHYRGIDERIRTLYVNDEISIGDYVLSGGELPAMVLVDAVVRLLPGAIGNFESAQSDSFQEGLLACPWYTRPRVFEGEPVPDVLINGDHREIARWRRRQALLRTSERRPDLLDREALSEMETPEPEARAITPEAPR
ncbi:MAG: tRNA (guanosine(37)-N1)-methyltransferase TrmD [Candidatus Handelsmanbacteria bacterium RIFCSPLOWO2_12_FULL_64_10]|uniref:tRNA (guanine-N(1)-)-methyltransferase n=1 Tax=Handelsmanbacteria sp. (strain RIFCSPLOWO2_12_FULL_64_10) TaxID=1817868 RepID=A0A1F6CRE3_HANXR|nr:MAG: tRNA (guanosine(37)-N1)-methyltransferase TrmD [Candidatus Handelsmanbacteria bacterium RIFCSPLOWO2_12_FULL_64_10]